MPGLPAGQLNLAVVTGAHPFDVPAFTHLFRSLPGINAYIQSLDDFANDWGQVRESYDAVLFYNMHMDDPQPPEHVAAALTRLPQTGQGVIILHHALLAWPKWPLWTSLVGMAERGFGYFPGESITVNVAPAGHPITAGLSDWEMVDETYTMNDPDPGCVELLTVDHPRSMRVVGWAHQVEQARVFCMALGHDHLAFEHPSFRQVLGQAAVWAANR